VTDRAQAGSAAEVRSRCRRRAAPRPRRLRGRAHLAQRAARTRRGGHVAGAEVAQHLLQQQPRQRRREAGHGRVRVGSGCRRCRRLRGGGLFGQCRLRRRAGCVGALQGAGGRYAAISCCARHAAAAAALPRLKVLAAAGPARRLGQHGAQVGVERPRHALLRAQRVQQPRLARVRAEAQAQLREERGLVGDCLGGGAGGGAGQEGPWRGGSGGPAGAARARAAAPRAAATRAPAGAARRRARSRRRWPPPWPAARRSGAGPPPPTAGPTAASALGPPRCRSDSLKSLRLRGRPAGAASRAGGDERARAGWFSRSFASQDRCMWRNWFQDHPFGRGDGQISRASRRRRPPPRPQPALGPAHPRPCPGGPGPGARGGASEQAQSCMRCSSKWLARRKEWDEGGAACKKRLVGGGWPAPRRRRYLYAEVCERAVRVLSNPRVFDPKP
jgi:hypothetical protein